MAPRDNLEGLSILLIAVLRLNVFRVVVALRLVIALDDLPKSATERLFNNEFLP